MGVHDIASDAADPPPGGPPAPARAVPLIALLALAGAVACDHVGPLVADPDREPASLRVRAPLYTWTGATEPLAIEILDADGVPFEPVPPWIPVDWYTADTTRVDVTGGVLAARAAGTATVRARAVGLFATADVEVRPILHAIGFAREPSIVLGDTSSFRLSAEDAGGEELPVPAHWLDWSSSDDAVAVVDPGGVARGLQRGVVEIIGTLNENGGGPALEVRRSVRVRPAVTALAFDGDALELLHGDTADLPAVTAFDAGGAVIDDVVLTWAVSDATVVKWAAERLAADRVGATQVRATVPDNGSAGPLSADLPVYVNPRSLRFRVDAAFATQSVQRYGGGVPLVAGREAKLRVFVDADRLNFFGPAVNVHVYHDGVAATTLAATRFARGIPEAPDQSALGDTWNVILPPGLVRPGLAVRIEVDADGTIPREPGSVDAFPAGAGLLDLDVRELPPFPLVMVPITQTAFNTTGNVTAGNLDTYLDLFLRIFPIAGHSVQIRSPFVTDRVVEGETDWYGIILDLRLLRAADGRTDYYYGVLRRHGGFAGLGYVGFPVAIGYDDPNGRSDVFAHEIGHNFGQWHTPCGGPGNVDPAYPYADGSIGHWGWDRVSRTLIAPTTFDVMGYCRPRWSSDYTYARVVEFRQNSPFGSAPEAAERAPALVIRGRAGQDGVALEPAFVLDVAPAADDGGGPYRIEGLDAAGAPLFVRTTEGLAVGHDPGGERHFLVTVPLAEARPERLATLRLSGGGALAELRAASPPALRAQAFDAAADGVVVRAETGDRVAVNWDAERHPHALIRDPATGETLALLRGGRATLPTAATELEVHLSDGVSSVARRLPVEGRP